MVASLPQVLDAVQLLLGPPHAAAAAHNSIGAGSAPWQRAAAPLRLLHMVPAAGWDPVMNPYALEVRSRAGQGAAPLSQASV
jgi:hypothetical protein